MFFFSNFPPDYRRPFVPLRFTDRHYFPRFSTFLQSFIFILVQTKRTRFVRRRNFYAKRSSSPGAFRVSVSEETSFSGVSFEFYLRRSFTILVHARVRFPLVDLSLYDKSFNPSTRELDNECVVLKKSKQPDERSCPLSHGYFLINFTMIYFFIQEKP